MLQASEPILFVVVLGQQLLERQQFDAEWYEDPAMHPQPYVPQRCKYQKPRLQTRDHAMQTPSYVQSTYVSELTCQIS